MDTSTFGILKSFSYGIFVPLFAYTGVNEELVLILSLLIFLDITTAIIREWITGGKIESRTLWIGVASKLLLICVPFVLILIGKGASIDFTPISKLALSTFIVFEGYSILGNIVQIRLKDKTIHEQDAITLVLRKAQEIIKNIINTLTSSNAK